MAHFPANRCHTSIISVLLRHAEFDFREHDDDGNLIPYRIMWKQGHRYLGDTETLAGAGVQAGHTLVMTHEGGHKKAGA